MVAVGAAEPKGGWSGLSAAKTALYAGLKQFAGLENVGFQFLSLRHFLNDLISPRFASPVFAAGICRFSPSSVLPARRSAPESFSDALFLWTSVLVVGSTEVKRSAKSRVGKNASSNSSRSN